jgi:hypothetical protein
MYNKNTDLDIGVQEGFYFQSYPRFLNALSKGINCSFCQTKLSDKKISMYPHDGGIYVTKYGNIKQWVYVTCSKCEYQWSWIKILRRFYK